MITYFGISGIAINAFVLTLLLSKEKKKLTDWLLSGWLVSLGLNQAFFLWSDANIQDFPFILNLFGMGMVLVHTPLIYLFVVYAFRQHIPAANLWHSAPFLMFISVFGFYHLKNPGAMRVQDGFIVFIESQPFPLEFYGLFFALIAGSYTLAALYKTRLRKEEMDQYYSNQVREVFLWLQRWIIAAVIFFFATWLFIQLSFWYEQVQPVIVFPVVSSFISLYIFYICFMGIRYSGVFHDTIPEIRQQLQVANPDEIAQLHKHAKHIASVMESQKPYLNPDLTLPELAGISGLTTGKTSQVLNQIIGKSFYTFVNENRAEHFIRNMNNPDFNHLSLIGLAFECGFKTKSTFNKIFKSYTGHTPSQYRKKMSEKSPPV